MVQLFATFTHNLFHCWNCASRCFRQFFVWRYVLNTIYPLCISQMRRRFAPIWRQSLPCIVFAIPIHLFWLSQHRLLFCSIGRRQSKWKISHRNQFRYHFIQLVYKKTSRYNSGMFCCKETRIVINSCCSICLEDDGISVSELPYVFQCQCQYIVHKKCFAEWLAREPRCLICDKSVVYLHNNNERYNIKICITRVVVGICIAYLVSLSFYKLFL